MNLSLMNLKLLLVDDDPQIRLGLEALIRSHFPQESLSVFSCANGLIASQLLAQENIDILITDIKMPLCSGLELLQIINEQHYNCRSIVLSGYDDFNLVRDALRLGATDYLLKPVDEGMLMHAIEEMAQMLSGDFSSSAPSIPPSSVLKKQQLLEAFFSDSPVAFCDARRYMENHNLTDQTPCLLCYVDIKRALYSNHMTMFQFLADRVHSYLTHLSTDGLQAYAIYGGIGTYWILLLFAEQPSDTPDIFLRPFLQTLKKDHLKFSLSPSWLNALSLAEGEALCKKGFEKYYFDTPYQKPEDTDPRKSLDTALALAAKAAAEYDYSVTIQHLEHVFALFNELRPSVPDLKKTMHNFVYSILSYNPAFITIVSSSKFTDYDILDDIETAESLSVLQKKIYASISHMIEALLSSLENKDDYVIQRAKTYIQNNYQDALTLNDVASHVFLNSNYFSTLFKQKTGNTFRNYLRDYRVEIAKKLLSTTPLRIYEVGLQVGYNEQSHFVRAFKSVTGLTPKEYREHIIT